MTENFHFLLGWHPVDLLQLALREATGQRAPDARPPLVIVTAGGRSGALATGFLLPENHPGLAGLLQYPTAQLVAPVLPSPAAGQPPPEQPVAVLFPAAFEEDAAGAVSLAELLDRFRGCLSEYGEVWVTIPFARLGRALPPLGPRDELTCYWEVRDRLDEAAQRGFAELAGRLEWLPGRFHGVRLYQRRGEPDAPTRARAGEMARLAGGCVAGTEVLALG